MKLTDSLSPRQREVLLWRLKGLPLKSIGIRLGISDETVKDHNKMAMLKLRAKTLAAAAMVAVREGLVK
jgi:DNA-binding CsgD family transcriptional regulator